MYTRKCQEEEPAQQKLCLHSVKMFHNSSKLLHNVFRHRSFSKQIRCKSSTESEPNSKVDKQPTNGKADSTNSEDTVQVERYDSLTIIGLNRTQKRNAINQGESFNWGLISACSSFD